MSYDNWKLATPPEYDELGPEPEDSHSREDEPKTMQVTKRSAITGDLHTQEIAITPEQWDRWKGGELLQNVCPHLDNDDREFLISGATKEEWAHYFGKGEPEDG